MQTVHAQWPGLNPWPYVASKWHCVRTSQNCSQPKLPFC